MRVFAGELHDMLVEKATDRVVPLVRARRSGRSILVVDDEPLLGLDLTMILEDASYDVIGPVASVEKGLSRIARDRPDGAILDISLAHGRSDALADCLAEMGVPFLFVSAHPRDVVAEAHRDRTHIEKPFTEQVLLARLAEMFGH